MRPLAATIERDVGGPLADRRWTRIGLVNNAAATGVLGPIESTDPASLLRHAAVNWVAPASLIAFMLRRTPPQTPLRIVNVSSGAAVQAFPGLSDYCAGKAALRMAGMVAAAELDSLLRTAPPRPDTAILSYEPGAVDTAMQEEARSRSLDEYPWGRLFRNFHASGTLVAPAIPAAEIVDFREGDGHARFTERRLRSVTPPKNVVPRAGPVFSRSVRLQPDRDHRPTRMRIPASSARTAMSGYGSPSEVRPARPVRINQTASNNMPRLR